MYSFFAVRINCDKHKRQVTFTTIYSLGKQQPITYNSCTIHNVNTIYMEFFDG